MPLKLRVLSADDPHPFWYDYPFERSEILLGRRGGVDIVLPDARVAPAQARIAKRGSQYLLVADAAGVRLGDTSLMVGDSRKLEHGERIAMGPYILEVHLTQTLSLLVGDSLGATRKMAREVLQQLDATAKHPRLVPQQGSPLDLSELQRTYTVGVGPTGAPALDDVDMWQPHIALERNEGGVTLRPVSAQHSIAVNGKRVSSERKLRDGDSISLGPHTLRFVDPAEAYLRALDHMPTQDRRPDVVSHRPLRGLHLLLWAGAVVAIAALLLLVLLLLVGT